MNSNQQRREQHSTAFAWACMVAIAAVIGGVIVVEIGILRGDTELALAGLACTGAIASRALRTAASLSGRPRRRRQR
jgi:predicted benzoate:H+ symporter BenE